MGKMMFCRLLLSALMILCGFVTEGAVGKLVEGNLILQAGERWDFKVDPEGTLSSFEMRGKFLVSQKMYDSGNGWGIVMTDSGNDTVANITAKNLPSLIDAELMPPRMRVMAVSRIMGRPDCGSENRLSGNGAVLTGEIDDGEVSIVVNFTDDGIAEIWYGDERLSLLGSVGMRGVDVSEIGITAFSPMEIVSVNVKADTRIADYHTDWNRQDFDVYLRSSSDFREGIYEYLDSDIDTARSRLGGHYSLAVISDGKGGYDIIYLDGAKENSQEWRAGMRKGRLSPTIFQNHYDLFWLDSNRYDDMEELSCELDGTLMVLHFPHERAVVRFSRCHPTR